MSTEPQPAPEASGSPRPSRRVVLKLGLGGAAVLLLGGGGLWWLRGSAKAVPGLRVLSAHQYRTLAAIARTQIPVGGPFALGAADLHVARRIDAYLADEPAATVRDVGRALLLVEFGPLLFDHRLTTFSRLAPAARLAHWRSWITSSSSLRRQVGLGLRKLIAFMFFSDAAVAPALGYSLPHLPE